VISDCFIQIELAYSCVVCVDQFFFQLWRVGGSRPFGGDLTLNSSAKTEVTVVDKIAFGRPEGQDGSERMEEHLRSPEWSGLQTTNN